MRRSEIESILPLVIARALPESRPLGAALDVMEALHAPAELALESLDVYLDPRRTPDTFLPLLARWLDLEFLVAAGSGRLREVLANAVNLSNWRGSRKGLEMFLTLATGIDGFQVSEPLDRPFHIAVVAPAAARVHATLVRQIIEREKPAYVTFELDFTQS